MKLKFKQVIWFIILIAVLGCDKPETDSIQNEPVPVGKFLDEWTYRVNSQSANIDIAEFRLWIPDTNNTSGLKAILVLSSHYNSNGLALAHSDEWQEYAINNDLCLLSVHLKSLKATTASESYTDASNGSGQALLTALNTITKKHNMPEVALLPFLLRGYSGGGMFSYSFAAFVPKRVIAFANIRGGAISTSSIKNKDIPGIMLIGELDEPERNTRIKNAVRFNRNQNGLWNYAVEPNEGHYGGLSKSDELIKRFFSSALMYRVYEGTNELLSISYTFGWLGNNESKSIFSYDTYPDDKNSASWLIDESFAHAWKNFQAK